MRKALAIILLLALVAAQGIDDPKLVKSLDMIMSESGTVISTGSLYEVDINLTIPQESTYLTAEYSTDTVVDNSGNVFASVYSSNPTNPFTYTVTTTLSSRERTITSLPEEYEILTEHVKYMQPSEHALSDSPQLKLLAEEITAGSTTDFERVAKLAIWVNNNINYDISLVGSKKDSDWVLANKRGVCVEYASLFNAFARSIGIPSRYVLGQAYGDYGWLGHAWSEVFLGEWVPVDPTWLEVGQLDATHIAFFRSVDTEATSKVSAKVAQGNDLTWDKPDFAGNKDDDLQISLGSIEFNDEVTPSPIMYGTDELGFGESTVVYLPVETDDYRVVDLRLLDCTGTSDVLELDESEKDLILEPKTPRVASWVVTSNSLNPMSIYTCPLTLNSGFLQEESIDMVVQKQSSPPSFTATLKQDEINLGESQTIYVETVSSGFDIGYVSSDGYKRKAAAATRQSFTFTPTKLGVQEAHVFTSEGGVQTLDFNVVHNADFFVKDILTDSSSPAGGQLNVAVVIANNREQAEDIEVRVSFDEQSFIKRVHVDETETLRMSFSTNAPGEKELKVIASAPGFFDEDTLSVLVYEPPSVTANEPEFTAAGDAMAGSISFNVPSDALNVTLELNNQTLDVGSEAIGFQLAAGTYSATLRWMDVAGNPYAEKISITVPKEMPSEPIVIQVGGFDPLIIVLAVGTVLALVFLLLLVVLVIRRLRPKQA